MSSRPCWKVECDQCGVSSPPAATSAEAERRAVRNGWLAWEGRYGRCHACRNCRSGLTADLQSSLDSSEEVRGANT